MSPEKTILIIDDDHNLRETLALIFRHAGYQVVCAADVEQASHSLTDQGCDLVVYDINQLNSVLVDTVSKIHGSHPAIPIVVLTGNLPIDLLSLSEEKKVSGYLEKPVDPCKILIYIAEFFRKS